MKIVTYLIIFLIAILLGLAITIDPGYVLIAYNRWTAEMPLWFAIIAILLIFFLLHHSMRIWKFITNINEYLHIRKIKKHFHKKRPLTDSGLLAFIEEDWQNLSQLLPKLKKQRLFKTTTYKQLEINVYTHLLATQTNLKNLQDIWQDIPRTSRSNSALVSAYCSKLIDFNLDEAAAKIIEKQLPLTWNGSIIELYSLAKTKTPLNQLNKLEPFLKSHKNNPTLLLALGRIAARCKLWGKTEEHLNMYFKVGGTNSIAYTILGYTFEQQGKHEQALAAYQSDLSKINP